MSNAQPGFVYLCRNKRNGYVKIGYSTNPAYRESTLQSEEPDIFFEHVAPGSLQDEQSLHRIFAEKRIRGEWFEMSPKDIDRAKWILSGCPDDPMDKSEEEAKLYSQRVGALRFEAVEALLELLNCMDDYEIQPLIEELQVLKRIGATQLVMMDVATAWSLYEATPEEGIKRKGHMHLPPML